MPPPDDVGEPELVGDGPVGRGLRILPLGSGVFCCDACRVTEDPALRVDVFEPMETSRLTGERFLDGEAAAKARAAGVATMESAGRTEWPEEGMRATRRLPSSDIFFQRSVTIFRGREDTDGASVSPNLRFLDNLRPEDFTLELGRAWSVDRVAVAG